ncbi:MAG: phosphoribosylanthranilate isomerase [Myxococcota bacterium]
MDWVGLNFWPGSKRFVTPTQASRLEALLDPAQQRVALFVDADPDSVRAALDGCRIDLLQFHGDESPEYCRSFGHPFMKAFRLRDPAVLAQIPDFLDGPDHPFLVDAWVPGAVGGTGVVARRDLALRAGELPGRMILAGGLTPETVSEAIATVRPWAIDVASGVESAPGHKDPALVAALLAAVRGTP